jgi:hypothetical protein
VWQGEEREKDRSELAFFSNQRQNTTAKEIQTTQRKQLTFK